MSPPSPPLPRLEVESFEVVSARPGVALLRLAGRWHSLRSEHLGAPVLLIDDGVKAWRLAALAGPDEATPRASVEGVPWRAAFSAPAEVAEGHSTAFSLAVGSQTLAKLPRPVAHPMRPVGKPAVPEAQRLEELTHRAAAAESHVQELVADVERLTGELAQAQSDARSQVARLEAQLSSAQGAEREAPSRARDGEPTAESRPDPWAGPLLPVLLLAIGLTAAVLLLIGVIRLVVAP